MGTIAAMFGKLKEATPSPKTPYFVPGKHRVRIEEVLVNVNSDGICFFIVSGTIVQSTVPEKVGTNAGQVIKITGNKCAMSNVKDFLAGAMGASKADKAAMESIDGPMLEKIVESKALVGMVLEVECHIIKTKEKGTDFTVHNWSLPKDA